MTKQDSADKSAMMHNILINALWTQNLLNSGVMKFFPTEFRANERKKKAQNRF
ncbi:hypothetical protein [Niabella hibiscisoli]|uniref:hypothetical protein n=1 Tax=Niabella hibiscisoli TaxID=1825928 RepID=UPI001F0FEFAB|nr:hypothetical protein [Niabella hibiscisoli]MCH5717880.1 hypothetical protein [Niabella hibiscisoli]